MPQLSSSQHQDSGTLRQGTPYPHDTAATPDGIKSGGVEPEELRDDASSAPAPQPGVHCRGTAAAVRHFIWPYDSIDAAQ